MDMASSSSTSNDPDPVALALQLSQLDAVSIQHILDEGDEAVDVEAGGCGSTSNASTISSSEKTSSSTQIKPWVPHSESEPLLTAVQKRPCLYDPTLKENRDDVYKGNAWAAVAEELGRPVTGKLNFLSVFMKFS